MSLQHLDNLCGLKLLKHEPPDQLEFDHILNTARRNLKDAFVPGISEEGKFTFVYNAAHAFALGALRWHGYRSEKRYLAFQCLVHTVGMKEEICRIFDSCHHKRNLAEYEGDFEISEELFQEMLKATYELKLLVEALPGLAAD